ncbi:hypothetical protein V492_08326 [Pseudogymnoascus sp. VKM F-4246]|nr:hypothetical protein V492_08326 [Pseudogymnoascus sp. VKM F-4246]
MCPTTQANYGKQLKSGPLYRNLSGIASSTNARMVCNRCVHRDEYELTMEREVRLRELDAQQKRLDWEQTQQTFWKYVAIFAGFTAIVLIGERIYGIVQYGVGPCPPCPTTAALDDTKFISSVAKKISEMSVKESIEG